VKTFGNAHGVQEVKMSGNRIERSTAPVVSEATGEVAFGGSGELNVASVIAEVSANLDEMRSGQRQATHALRNAAHAATRRRVHQMRHAAKQEFIGQVVGAAAEAAASTVTALAGDSKTWGAVGPGVKDAGEIVGAAFSRSAKLANARAESDRDQAQAASEQASDASSDAEQAQRLADKAMNHLGEIQQQLNRGREAAIRG
jgi:hypothetical protein